MTLLGGSSMLLLKIDLVLKRKMLTHWMADLSHNPNQSYFNALVFKDIVLSVNCFTFLFVQKNV